MDLRIFIPHRLEYTEHVLFLILTFGGSTIRNSWATPLATATRTIRELILFKSSYISSLYGISFCNFALLQILLDYDMLRE